MKETIKKVKAAIMLSCGDCGREAIDTRDRH